MSDYKVNNTSKIQTNTATLLFSLYPTPPPDTPQAIFRYILPNAAQQSYEYNKGT